MTEIEFSVFTGYIIRILDKRENGNATWYRCEAKGTVSTPNKGFNDYLKRHRFRFTIRARKNLKSGMYVTIVGQPHIWTSPRGFDIYSLDGVVLIDGAFTFKSIQSMLEGVGREYSPITELPELLNAYRTAGYSPVQALVDMGKGESTFMADISADSQLRILQALQSDVNTLYENLVLSILAPYVGTNNQFARHMYQLYGMDAFNALQDNPWEMWFTIPRMTLAKCDEMATKLGIDIETDERRTIALIRHYIQQTVDELGYTYLPSEFAEDMYQKYLANMMSYEEFEDYVDETNDIYVVDGGYQTKPLYLGENRIIDGVQNLSEDMMVSFTPDRSIDGLELTDEQYDAVCKSLKSRLFLLTGGPGVGKTTTLKALIQAHLDAFQLSTSQVMLMAPTGKAAHRMSEQTGLVAKTIHNSLRVVPGALTVPERIIQAFRERRIRLIVIDEASMLDTELAGIVFELTQEIYNCKLILVGDSAQLPSIGPGQVLLDLLDKKLPHATLTKVQRQAEGSPIVELAQAVSQGQFPTKEWFDERPNVYFAPVTSNNLISRLQNGVLGHKVGKLDNVQIITPYRNQSNSDSIDTDTVSQLNHYTQPFFTPDTCQPRVDDNRTYNGNRSVGRLFRVGDKVICKKNLTEKVVNGSVGTIIGIDLVSENIDEHAISVQFGEDVMDFVYEDNGWFDIELAYAITAHQSQGSEYETVIIPVVRSSVYSPFLTRNILYTALTRAKTNLILLGDYHNFANIVAKETPKRVTRLQSEL